MARIARLEIRGERTSPSENAIAKVRREALDLVLDGGGHVHRRARWHVTVGVARMLPERRSCCIKLTLLGQEHERLLRMLAAPDECLRAREFVKATGDVHG